MVPLKKSFSMQKPWASTICALCVSKNYGKLNSSIDSMFRLVNWLILRTWIAPLANCQLETTDDSTWIGAILENMGYVNSC